MTLEQLLTAVPVVVTTGEEILMVIAKLKEAAALRGLDNENLVLDRVIAEANAAKAEEDARRGL